MTNRLFSFFVASIVLAGCAGGRGKLRFDNLDYPVSSSAYLYTPSDVTGLEVVGELYLTKNLWGIGWSLIPLHGKVDLSDRVNFQIERYDGEGIINLSITTDNCGINYVWPLNLTPVWPGCVAVGIQGDIVRAKRGASAAHDLPDADAVAVAAIEAASEHR